MIDLPVISLIGVGAVGLLFALALLLPRRHSNEELGIRAVYEERCGGQTKGPFGFSSGGNIPCLRISLYDTSLVIGFIGPTKVPYNDIESAEHQRRWVSKRINITTHGSRIEFELLPNNPQEIIDILREKGVRVAER